MRTERDGLGEKEIPDNVLYGIHTCRSLDNFNVAGVPLPLELVRGMVLLKKACAKANAELNLLKSERAEAIAAAADEVLAGLHAVQFPIDVFQAGSGTSSNMNVNEVLANIACEKLGGRRGDRTLVHPNDHVNRGQSTNNIFPSGIRMACLELNPGLLSALKDLRENLDERAVAFANVLKSGRTHLQDAVPVSLGQEFSAWSRALAKDEDRLLTAAENLLELGVGGNAVGTGINTPAEFRSCIMRHIAEDTGLRVRAAQQGLEATQFLTDMLQYAGALEAASVDLNKIANDLRLLASGPNTGFGEIVLPAVEPGSSIMPGKINPSICEALNMACMQVLGLGQAVRLACAAGQLELNTHMPLVGANLVQMIHLLRRSAIMLGTKAVSGIQARPERCRDHFERSAGLATILNPRLGYDAVAALVKEGLLRNLTLRELVIEKQLMPSAELDALIAHSTGPHV